MDRVIVIADPPSAIFFVVILLRYLFNTESNGQTLLELHLQNLSSYVNEYL